MPGSPPFTAESFTYVWGSTTSHRQFQDSLAAAAGKPYNIPFRGPVSWLHAGEVASAFLKAVSREREGAPVYDIDGVCETVENSMLLLTRLKPSARITCSGNPLPYPMDLSDDPLRAFIGDYGHVSLEEGMRSTLAAFRDLLARGQLSAESVG